MGPADLVAEIVSLQGRSRDRIEKRDLYEQHGVKEYWIIDPEAQTVEVLALVSGRYELVRRSLPGKRRRRGCCPASRFPSATSSAAVNPLSIWRFQFPLAREVVSYFTGLFH